LSTPNDSLSASRTTTTLTTHGADVVDVGNETGSLIGIQGTLSIESPLHSTSLYIYGARGETPATTGAVRTVQLAAPPRPVARLAPRAPAPLKFARNVAATVKHIDRSSHRKRSHTLPLSRTASRPLRALARGLNPVIPPIVIDSDRISGLTPADILFESN